MKVYSLNNTNVQLFLGSVLVDNFTQIETNSVPLPPLLQALARLDADPAYPLNYSTKYLYLGVVMWIINNNHQVPELILNKAYTYATEFYEIALEKMDLNNNSKLPSNFMEDYRQGLQEEITIINFHAQHPEQVAPQRKVKIAKFIAHSALDKITSRARFAATATTTVRMRKPPTTTPPSESVQVNFSISRNRGNHG